MTKYKQYYEEMVAKNQEIFVDFKKVHDLFASNRLLHQNEFNLKGEIVLEIIHDWEKKLCLRMEKGKNSTYSSNLAEKFRAEVKKYLPLIDLIGVKLSFAA